MNKRYWIFLFLIFGIQISFGVVAQSEPENITAVSPSTIHSTATTTYIIQFADPPLATWMQTQAGGGLNFQSNTAVSYQNTLAVQQQTALQQMIRTLDRPLTPRFRYTMAYNGMALQLTGTEAAELSGLSGVTAVYREQQYELTTDAGPNWIDADDIWDGSGTPNNSSSKGEGIIIGVIDTGINTDHPSFADVGGDGYNHTNPLGSGTYKGLCVSTPSLCNDKLIGQWDYVDGYWESGGAEDNEGHGSHTAGTAAGNVIQATITAPTGYTYQKNISGVAPHANLIAYDACFSSCLGSALLAAIDQAVTDGVDVINYSISGSSDPYNDPISQAFLAANEAGIFVAVAAGNDGPAANTLSHISPWVTAVAATTHNRTFTNALTNLTSDTSPLANITGQSITSGYKLAPIVYAGDYGDALCFNDFVPGTWQGEIVICDRGQNSRVQKGVHVLSGGAGAMILANSADDGNALNSDVHVLPALHITYNDGVMLKHWLASGTNHMGRIQGTAVSTTAPGDSVASFSSRGPNTMFDVLKPDLSAPGVDIIAPIHTTSPAADAEFGILSGTSMASPHAAGAAALVKAIHPTWTPDEIRSAMMMTSHTSNLKKEDGTTPADAFDNGAGRVDLTTATQAGLVLDETRANYDASNPFTGGEPQTLNVPSLMNSSCFQTCTWTRTVRSTLDVAAEWTVTAVSATGLQLDTTPNTFTLTPGQSQTIQISADVTQFFSDDGWAFGTIQLASTGQVPLHIPVAVNKTIANQPNTLTKSALLYAEPGQIITYQIELNNLDNINNTYFLTDTLPANVSYVNASATGGLVYDPGNHQFTWSGLLGPGQLGYEITQVTPLSYVNLGDVVNPPDDICSLLGDCDEGTAVFDLTTTGNSVTFFGDTLTTLNASTNGFIYGPNGLTGPACTACPQPLPNIAEPNQLIAGLWRDIDMSGGNGQWYGSILTGLLDNPSDKVFYVNWHNAGQLGNPFLTSQHAIAIVLDGQSEPAGRIYLIYNHISDPDALSEAGYTIGVENSTGTVGLTQAFTRCQDTPCVNHGQIGTLPTNGTTLRLDPAIVSNNTKVFTYQVQINGDVGDLITNEVVVTSDGIVTEGTAVTNTKVGYRYYYPIVGK